MNSLEQAGGDGAQWYYAMDGRQHGPVSEGQLSELVWQGQLDREALVWTSTMAQWQPLPDSKFASLLRGPEPEPKPTPTPPAPLPPSTPAPAGVLLTEPNWYLEAWRKYADFQGRARRKEYFTFVLGNFGLSIMATLMDAALFDVPVEGELGPLGWLVALAILVPSWAVLVRRLHDTGRSGWSFVGVLAVSVLVLAFLVGAVGDSLSEDDMFGLIGLWVLVVMGWSAVVLFGNSQPGENKYGPNPKGVNGPAS